MDMMLYKVVMPMMSSTGNNIGQTLGNLRNSLGNWAGYVVGILGVAALVVGLWNIITGMISHGKKQTNWLISIGLLLIGGVLMGWGITSVRNIANKGDVQQILKNTVSNDTQGGFSNWTTENN